MTPSEYGVWLAEAEPPISDDQAQAAARIILCAGDEAVAA